MLIMVKNAKKPGSQGGARVWRSGTLGVSAVGTQEGAQKPSKYRWGQRKTREEGEQGCV